MLRGPSFARPVLDMGPGDAVGLLALSGQCPHLLEVQTTENTQVLLMPQEQFLEARQRLDPLFGRFWMSLCMYTYALLPRLEAALAE